MTAASDPSDLVRGYAYEGLAHLLGADSLDDLRRGAADPNPEVRGAIATHAYNLHRRIDRDEISRGLRRLVEQLRSDPDRSVVSSAEYILWTWDKS